MAREILDLGFNRISLSEDLTAPQVAELLKAQEKLGFHVDCLEGFCPLPPEGVSRGQEAYEFTSHRKDRRERSVQLAVKALEMAVRFGARVVVLRAGVIRTSNATNKLKQIAGKGRLLEKEYARKKCRFVLKRKALGEAYIQRVLDGLAEVVDHAAASRVKVGLANGDTLEAVPSEEEITNLLDRLDSSAVGSWHDFGAAQIKDHLWLLDHQQWLEKGASNCIGATVHNVRWPFEGEQLPFQGEIDFPSLLRFLPPDTPRVLRVNSKVSAEEIAAAASKLNSLS